MLSALEKGLTSGLADRRMALIRAGGEPYVLQRKRESTALEELCAMNIRFNENGVSCGAQARTTYDHGEGSVLAGFPRE